MSFNITTNKNIRLVVVQRITFPGLKSKTNVLLCIRIIPVSTSFCRSSCDMLTLYTPACLRRIFVYEVHVSLRPTVIAPSGIGHWRVWGCALPQKSFEFSFWKWLILVHSLKVNVPATKAPNRFDWERYRRKKLHFLLWKWYGTRFGEILAAFQRSLQ